jgi:hypothetical protein
MTRACYGSCGIAQLRLWRLLHRRTAAVTVTTVVCILVAKPSGRFCPSRRSKPVLLLWISRMTLLSLWPSISPPRSYAPRAPTMILLWLLRRLRARKRARDGPC